MKRAFISILLAALTVGAVAQNADSIRVENNTIGTNIFYGEYENAPQFPGGKEALMQFLDKNVQYPDAAEDGSLSDISARDCKINRFNTTKFSQETESKQKELKEQFAKLFAKEAYRVIKKMPKWVPGKQNGKISRLRYNIRIDFINPYK